ncbi:hypothetical protein BJY04DRAFT_223491 [Aspergillus karnatakaensis]|uniref:bZIP transcription factor n=1 Tax=Aspergillus karnatakaensis TaxID=1810916 RepID=UPI003CCC9CED
MDSAIEQKRLDKLARIRDNQRKSRARRQDHLRELEHKVHALQTELDRKDVEGRLAMQKLEAENRKLRDLLCSSGVPAEALEMYLQRTDNPMTTRKVAIPALQHPPSALPQSAVSTCSRPVSGASTPIADRAADHTVATTTEKMPTACETQSRPIKTEECQQPEIPSFCACPPGEGPEGLPISESTLNTTFCAIAERLVDQYNSRGVDVSEIRRKLREGFFRGTSEEGCRVHNQILFQVLDEISNH